MNERIPLPEGFDEPFFRWLDWVSEVLSIQFASTGSVPKPGIALLEQRAGTLLPADIRRFYTRYNPWDVLSDWSGWESTERAIRQALDTTATLAPIDCRSYSSQGCDTVAVVFSEERYEVVERWRTTGVVRRYANLRTFFIASVVAEMRDDPENGVTIEL